MINLTSKPLGLLWKYFKHTPFYKKHLAKRFAEIDRRIVGPRIQMYPLPLKEDGFDGSKYYVLQVGVVNQPDIKLSHCLGKNVTKIEEMTNSFTGCDPMPISHVRIRFFDSNWKLLPEPKLKRPSGSWLTLSLNGENAIDVAGLLKSGRCYGVTKQIGPRWSWGSTW